MAHEKTYQFDTNRLYVPASTAAPALLSVTAASGGGTLTNGVYYYYVVTAIKDNIESVISNENWAVALLNGTNTLTWTAVSGATAYNVYRGSSGSYSRWAQLGNVQTYADTNAMNVNIPTNIPYDRANDMARWLLWYYKSFLTGQIGGAITALWTVAGSSDSVTGAMDGVDRWGVTYDSAKIINNTAGNAHSWICLKSPSILGQDYYLIFDLNNSSFNITNLSMVAGAAPTGGSNTTAPTMTLPGTISNLKFSMSRNTGGYYPSGPFRVHGALATDGSFNILVSRNGTRNFVSGFLFHLLANYRVTDLFPVWMSYMCDDTLLLGYGNTVGSTGVGPDSIANTLMRTQTNNNFDRYSLLLPNTTNWPAGEDAFDLSFADWPLWVSKGNTYNGFVGIRGRVQDITYLSSSVNSGSTDTQFSPSYVAVGGSSTGNFRFPIDQRILWE